MKATKKFLTFICGSPQWTLNDNKIAFLLNFHQALKKLTFIFFHSEINKDECFAVFYNLYHLASVSLIELDHRFKAHFCQ